MTEKSRQKLKDLEDEKNFYGEIKNFEMNLIFLVKPFFLRDQLVKRKI